MSDNKRVALIFGGFCVLALIIIALVFIYVPVTSDEPNGQPLGEYEGAELLPVVVELPSGGSVQCIGMVADKGDVSLSCDWKEG